MPIFNFYRFDNKQGDNGPSLFAAEEAAQTRVSQEKYKTPEECFGSFFATRQHLQLNVLKSHGNGEEKHYELYNCDVVVPELQGIILLELESNGIKTTIENKQKIRHPNHPFCRIIIDNRPEHQIIAIEKNTAFSGDTDKAALVLQNGLNQKLLDYGREIVIQSLKKKSTDFWPVVWDIRKKFNDYVRFIKLDFREGHNARSANTLMAMISELTKKGDCDALFELKAKDGQREINLIDLEEDISNIAAICLEEGIFDLTVHFAHFGCYRYGADIMAQFGVDDEIIESFGHEYISTFDGKNPTFELVVWIDKMNEILKDYAKTGTIKRGRKTGFGKTVCRR